MFKKYAISLLQEVSGELEISSYCCKNAEDKKLLQALHQKVEAVLKTLEITQEKSTT
jgi:hypothetical protein